MNDIEDALKRLKYERGLKKGHQLDTSYLESLISALEKQIPAKPIELTRAIKVGIEGANCSSCGGLIFSSESYCKRCGQKLDWSEVKDE